MNSKNHTKELNVFPAGLEWMLQNSQVQDGELTEALAREYFLRIYRLAVSIVDNPLIAEQITQEVLERAVENRGRYWGDVPLTPWILSIALQVTQSWMRKRTWQGKNQVGQEAYLPPAASPEDSQMHWLFEALDSNRRLCLVLRYLIELSLADIALITGLSEGEVHRLLKGARSNIDYQKNLLLQEDVPGLSPHLLVTNQVERSLDGFINPAEQADLDRHLNACELCHRYKSRSEQLILEMKNYLSNRWPYSNPTDDNWASFLKDIRSQVASRKLYKKKALPLWEIALGAGIFLLIFSIGRLAHLDTPEPRPVVIVKVTATPSGLEQDNRFITATPASSVTSYPTPEKSYLYIVRPLESINEIAARMGLQVDIIQKINRLDPGKPLITGQVLVLPVTSPADGSMNPTPVTPPPSQPPLTVRSSQHEILLRIQESSQLWRTLWADVQITLYQPAGQVLLVYHKQLWASQPKISMVISGPAGGGPESLKRIQMISAGASSLYQYGEDVYNLKNYQINHFTGSELLDDPDLKNLFFPSGLGLASGTFENAGTSMMAGREALVWDWYDSRHNRVYRLYVDAKQGILLRLRRFGSHDPENPDFNAVVMNIALDQNFPVDLFDPAFSWPKNFARDYAGNGLMQGERIQGGSLVSVPSAQDFLPEIPMPAGFDPSKSFLTYQWSRAQTEASGIPLKVFADGYYLGKMIIGNPWAISSCKRSEDGRYIGMIEQLGEVYDTSSILRWFDLRELTKSLSQLPATWTIDFAFSPDDRTIANSGCMDIHAGKCGVYLWDTATSSNQLLIQEPFAWKLAWSPDGRYLAMIVKDPESDRLLIVRVRDGVISYAFPIDPKNPSIPSSSPTNRWAIAYPPATGGLEDCTFPPNIR